MTNTSSWSFFITKWWYSWNLLLVFRSSLFCLEKSPWKTLFIIVINMSLRGSTTQQCQMQYQLGWSR